MSEMWYNYSSTNHIKSSKVLEAPCYPFSTYDRGVDTMSDHTPTQEQSQNIPYGYCQCGCGQLAPITKVTRSDRGQVKGQPVSFIKGHNGRKCPPAPPGYKFCTKCNQQKLVSEFYMEMNDSRFGEYRGSCRVCDRDRMRSFRESHPEALARARERMRTMDEEKRLVTRRRRVERYWAQPEKYRLKAKKYKSDNPEREKAHSAVRRAIKCFELPPANTVVCERCQEALAAHYHHFLGYAEKNWLDVEALCLSCHGRSHWKY